MIDAREIFDMSPIDINKKFWTFVKCIFLKRIEN
jgi:hypothetical protein